MVKECPKTASPFTSRNHQQKLITWARASHHLHANKNQVAVSVCHHPNYIGCLGIKHTYLHERSQSEWHITSQCGIPYGIYLTCSFAGSGPFPCAAAAPPLFLLLNVFIWPQRNALLFVTCSRLLSQNPFSTWMASFGLYSFNASRARSSRSEWDNLPEEKERKKWFWLL